MPDVYSYYHSPEWSSASVTNNNRRTLRFVRLAIFFIGITLSPILLLIVPLYIRYRVFVETAVYVTHSDVLEMGQGISSVFCQAHTLKMNTSFNAYQIVEAPTTKRQYRKQITLRKTISLLTNDFSNSEFYFAKHSQVNLSVCSRNMDMLKLLTVKDNQKHGTNGSTLTLKTYRNRNRTVDEFYSMQQQQVRRTLYSAKSSSSPPDNRRTSVSTLKERQSHEQLYNNETTILATDNKTDNNSISEIVRYWRSRIKRFNKRPKKENQPLQQQTADENCLRIEHRINEDGHYCYVLQNTRTTGNTARLVFNITHPVYNYTTTAKPCVNKTACVFQVPFLSTSKIIIDLSSPSSTDDDSEQMFHSEADDTDETLLLLLSVCEPRVTIYAIFPIILMTILFFSALL